MVLHHHPPASWPSCGTRPRHAEAGWRAERVVGGRAAYRVVNVRNPRGPTTRRHRDPIDEVRRPTARPTGPGPARATRCLSGAWGYGRTMDIEDEDLKGSRFEQVDLRDSGFRSRPPAAPASAGSASTTSSCAASRRPTSRSAARLLDVRVSLASGVAPLVGRGWTGSTRSRRSCAHRRPGLPSRVGGARRTVGRNGRAGEGPGPRAPPGLRQRGVVLHPDAAPPRVRHRLLGRGGRPRRPPPPGTRSTCRGTRSRHPRGPPRPRGASDPTPRSAAPRRWAMVRDYLAGLTDTGTNRGRRAGRGPQLTAPEQIHRGGECLLIVPQRGVEPPPVRRARPRGPPNGGAVPGRGRRL